MRKIPEITIFFWIMKICATTLGETAGDLFSKTMNIGYAKGSLILVMILLAIFIIWRFTGESLSVDNIKTRKVELLE